MRIARKFLIGSFFTCRELALPESASSAAASADFELAGWAFGAAPEETRPPRVVRVGLAQNRIVLPTTAPVAEQRGALFRRVGAMIDAAGAAGVNVMCLQELWGI